MKPKNYKRDPREPWNVFRSEPRMTTIKGGEDIITKRVIGPSIGWRENHFLAFAPNWQDIANDVDPKFAEELRRKAQLAKENVVIQKELSKPPLIKDVKRRLLEMVKQHEQQFIETSTCIYPILRNGE